jgi:hypothetical protein
MTADLPGYKQALLRQLQRARKQYLEALDARKAIRQPDTLADAIKQAEDAMREFLQSLAGLHEPPPNPADFGIHEAQPQQETTMNEPSPIAATVRAARHNMEAIITAVIRDQIRIFERETGLEVQGVEVELATLTSPAGRETLVDSVDVRVGLGR